MPTWLIELLQQQNSKGFADTLAALVGGHPNYAQMSPQRKPGGIQMGKFGPNSTGQPNIWLALNNKNYQQKSNKGPLGDYVLAHEFGHMAAGGSKNPQLADQFADKLGEDTQESEDFADLFQQSVQFLRDPKADLSKLNEKQALITNILLQQPIYAQHPINQRRMLEQILMGQLPNR
jgi:hypothetical protein